MATLRCKPNVFVVRDRYQIIVVPTEQSVCWLEIGGKRYHEKNSTGVYVCQAPTRIFSVPQSALDREKSYTVVTRRIRSRKGYWSELDDPVRETYKFRPIEKDDDVHAFYLSDIHFNYDNALKIFNFVRDRIDLFIGNGDFWELEDETSLLRLNEMIGDITLGEIPCVIGRGNHDTRGALAEKIVEHIGTMDGKAYFDFSVGPLSGIHLDCGEDKLDDHAEYGGVNCFEDYRREELRFLKRVRLKDRPFRFAVGHVPFMSSLAMHGEFDIDRDVYAAWGREIDRLAPEFFISGHLHKLFYLKPDDERNRFSRTYPVVVGAAHQNGFLTGTEIIFRKSGTEMRFIDNDGNILREFRVDTGYTD